MMIVCVRCRKFFHPKKNGVTVEEGRPLDNSKKNWVPYKLWMADSVECRSCRTEIVAGFGLGPISEHYKPEYAEEKARRGVHVFVEDCP